MKSNKFVSIIEGHGEKSVIQYLKREGYTFGRTRIGSIETMSNISGTCRALNITDSTTVTVVMDVDTLQQGNHLNEKLKKNLEYLNKIAKEVRVITQNKNLDDELIKSLNLRTSKKLFDHFDATTSSNYKTKLAQITIVSLSKKLHCLNYDIFWTSKILNKFVDKKLLIDLNSSLADIN